MDVKGSGDDFEPRDSNMSGILAAHNKSVDKQLKKRGKNNQDDFINQEIIEDQEDPKEPSHFDYKYIKSKAGPLYKQKDAIEVEN